MNHANDCPLRLSEIDGYNCPNCKSGGVKILCDTPFCGHTTCLEGAINAGLKQKNVEETMRGQILDTAKSLTTGDRNKSYGPPKDNLSTYSKLCKAYLTGRAAAANDRLALSEIDAVDGAIFMVLAKISRIAANRGHKDNYIDGAAYMAIAGECDDLIGG